MHCSQYTFYGPWIESFRIAVETLNFPAVTDGTVFAWLSWPVFEGVQFKSGPRRCLHRGTWSWSPSPQGPTDHKRSIGPLLSLPEVHDQLFVLLTFRERQLSWHHDVSLSTSSKYASHHCWKWGPEPQYHQQI